MGNGVMVRHAKRQRVGLAARAGSLLFSQFTRRGLKDQPIAFGSSGLRTERCLDVTRLAHRLGCCSKRLLEEFERRIVGLGHSNHIACHDAVAKTQRWEKQTGIRPPQRYALQGNYDKNFACQEGTQK